MIRILRAIRDFNSLRARGQGLGRANPTFLVLGQSFDKRKKSKFDLNRIRNSKKSKTLANL